MARGRFPRRALSLLQHRGVVVAAGAAAPPAHERSNSSTPRAGSPAAAASRPSFTRPNVPRAYPACVCGGVLTPPRGSIATAAAPIAASATSSTKPPV